MPERPFAAQNKDQAMKQMKAKLYELEMQKRTLKNRRWKTLSLISAGKPDSFLCPGRFRIKDLRTGVETRNTQAVLDGSLDQFIEASLKAGL